MGSRARDIARIIRRVLARVLGSTIHEGTRRGASVAEGAVRISARLVEELRRELFGDTMFIESVIASLALLSIITLIGDILFPAGSKQAEAIYKVDLAICIILALEYIYRWSVSRDRASFIRHYWYEVLAFIPAYMVAGISSGLAVLLRLLRFARVYRVYRLFGRQNIYLAMLLDVLREARLLQLVTILFVGLGFTSLLAFMAEARVPNSGIQSLGDAFWWSLATVTTVGYGDVVPTTPLGKLLGVALMVFGIAILGGFISLTSASVLRVLMRYQRMYAHASLLDDFTRFRLLASRLGDLTDEEVEELARLARRLNVSLRRNPSAPEP